MTTESWASISGRGRKLALLKKGEPGSYCNGGPNLVARRFEEGAK